MVRHSLPLAEQALQLARNYLRQARDLEALHVLGQLVRLHPLDLSIAEQAQVLLAEIHLRRRDFAQARRHLHVALTYQPENAQYHFTMAVALEDDPNADPRRALHYYRKAVELEPNNAEYQAARGSFLLDMGKPRAGIRCLERAVELAPEDGQYAQQLAMAWASEGQFEKARRVALHALFRNPDDSRLRRLWDDLRFQEARQEQLRFIVTSEGKTAHARPVLLPFGRKRRSTPKRFPQADGTILRLDPPAPPSSPNPSRNRRKQSQ